MFSFGENVSISVEAIDAYSTRIDIHSGLKVQGNRHAIISGEGRNSKNVSAIIGALNSYLKTQKKPIPAADQKICLFCAESIKIEAIVCRYCGRDVQQAQPAPLAASNAAEIEDTSAAVPPPLEEAEYFFSDGAETHGPYGLTQMQQLFRDRQIIATTQVYHADFEWKPAYQLKIWG